MGANKNKSGAGKAAEIAALGLRLSFPEERMDLLKLALTHSTYFEGGHHGGADPEGDDNQRLEFLGDAVLDLVIGERLYGLYPEAREGELSKMRAYLVCEASLAAMAQKLGLAQCLRMGRGAEAGGDRERPSVQADAYESLIGALFLACGYEKARQFILEQFGTVVEGLTPEDYEDKKSLLQELVQAKCPRGVTYKVLEHTGPDHKPHFRSGAYCGKILLGEGEGGSKKESELAAAAAALWDKNTWLNSI